ncbi:hypothetical protein [Pseudaestuariivita rosea]|uniref:hypothetical protein n=1 Tax=Pseudaestuariivita rosea TaxID=2763263 RepID=UPI001ABB0C8A|nr:hypothetical protein [Pseudaestuariivita rosea]
MSHLTQTVQVVLVFDNASAFDQHFSDLSQIEPRLTQALQDFGPWQSLQGYNTPNHLGLANDTQHITMQRFDEQMQLGGFADVLANPLITNGNPGLAKAVLEHQRAFLIEVGPGSVPGFAAALAQSGIADALGGMDTAEMGLSDDQAGYENRLLLAQSLTSAMIREMAPSAVHWVQSQQIFDAAAFNSLVAEGFSLPLYCGPFLYGGEQMPDGSVKVGIRALGSQNLLGKTVIFAPDVQDWSQSYMQVLAFIAYCRSIGRLLGDGETMASDAADATVVRVSHKNDIPQLPDGYIELSVDGRSNAEASSGKVLRADEAKLNAAARGSRDQLNQPKRARGGLLARLFGSKK